MLEQAYKSHRLVNTCRIIRIITVISMISLPLTSFMLPFYVSDYFRDAQGKVVEISSDLKLYFSFYSLMTSILPVMFLMNLYNLFTRYQQFDFFSVKQVSSYKKGGFWLFMTSLSYIMSSSLEDTLTNTHNDVFYFSISLDSTAVSIACSAIIMYCLGMVMQEGLKLKRENELVI